MADARKTRYEEIVSKQTFGSKQPGPLLSNIQAMINCLETGIPTTSKYFVLPQGCLVDLNEQMDKPLVHNLKRPQLRSFPTLAGLFLLLRASELAIGTTKPKRLVKIDPEMLERWNSLNPTEQYMSLLDTWLLKTETSILGGPVRGGSLFRTHTQTLYESLSPSSTNVGEARFDFSGDYEVRVVTALLEQFGWISAKYASTAAPGAAAGPLSMKRTQFGDAVLKLIGRAYGYVNPKQPTPAQKLKHLFPQFENSLQPLELACRPGGYLLKLSWRNVWRRVLVPGTLSLADLTSLLLELFEFEEEHLYQIEGRNRSGQPIIYGHPRHPDCKLYADEVLLQEAHLCEGESLELWYDFGDDWRFTITLEKVDESAYKDFEPQLKAQKGEAPIQYEYDDDDEFEIDVDEDDADA